MPIFLDAAQGTEQWAAMRLGHATASRFKDILGGKVAREAYMWELVGERLSRSAKRASTSQSTDWGHQSEPLAREEYQTRTGELTRIVGFAVHSKIKWVGASSDALVGAEGALEIKSPFNSGIHARTLGIGMPDDHVPQVQGNLWVLERAWLDFCSYDVQFPAPFNLYIQRLERDEAFIKHIEKEVKLFLAEVNIALRSIQKMYH